MTNINLDTLTQEELRDLQEKISEVLAAKKDVVPAEAWKKIPEGHPPYWYAIAGRDDIDWENWWEDTASLMRIQSGMAFPFTAEGRAAAEIRAKRGFIPHPGIHWQEDVKKLAEAKQKWGYAEVGDQQSETDLAAAVDDFLDKYAEGN